MWYIAGINGTDHDQTLSIGKSLRLRGSATVFFDGSGTSQPWDLRTDVPADQLPADIVCRPRGGFVIVVDSPLSAPRLAP
jgi:hypothetical protein